MAAAGINLAAVAAIFLLENWFASRKEIRPRAKDFFYLIDYKTIAWGDTVGLSLINFAVLSSWGYGFAGNTLSALVLLAIASVATWIAYRVWMAPGHPPSLTYPEFGRSNVITGLHLAYFFAQITIGLAGLYFIFKGSMTLFPELAILLGIIVYAISIGKDAKDGKF